MSKNIVTILFLTFITLVVWAAFQVSRTASETTIPSPTQEQIRPLNPTLDKTVFEDLKNDLR